MGFLLYGRPAEEIEIEDRTLAHIKIVILAKLRRGESFAFSFEHDPSDDAGRSTIWLNPAIPLRFKFEEERQPELDRRWLELLVSAANSVDGLRLIPEPEESHPPSAD
ncbi:hypothetical protein GCM10022239_24600 [Leifsonia bigeumensis]|uniref:DUF7882 domain-containing protein n=1 Tax=Leifsonella bigeumensis TaxID=433643 RepID=A0ABP7FX90_9MICO